MIVMFDRHYVIRIKLNRKPERLEHLDNMRCAAQVMALHKITTK